ncbi:MAG: TatD family hydrolase [Desulfurococcaceae archaeon]
MRKLYADSHCHSNPVKGMGADKISKLFKKHGGWFIALVSLPPYHYGLSEPLIDNYRKLVEIMLLEKKIVIENSLSTSLFIGFHPAEIDEYYRRGISLEKILELAEKVLDLLVEYYRNGLINGIGEVGRQHYSTSPARQVLAELILLKTLEYSKDYDIPLHLHLEQSGLITIKSINYYIEKLNVPRRNILIHHVNYDTGYWSEKYNLWHSIPAKERDIEQNIVEKREYILIESDYIDDPKRPGVSSYPWDIAINLEKFIERNIVDQNTVDKIMIDNIVKFYRVNPP